MTAALAIRDLNKNFGALTVARDIRLELPRGARHALIGPNGAGKTTLVNLITGVLRPTAGAILLDGHDITALPQAARTRRGISHAGTPRRDRRRARARRRGSPAACPRSAPRRRPAR